MLDFAFGELDLKPDEFWQLTWGEYYRMVRGYHRRARIDSHNTASILAAIYNTIPRRKGSEPYKAEDFMSAEQPRQGEDLSEDERVEIAKEKLKRIKKIADGRR